MRGALIALLREIRYCSQHLQTILLYLEGTRLVKPNMLQSNSLAFLGLSVLRRRLGRGHVLHFLERVPCSAESIINILGPVL